MEKLTFNNLSTSRSAEEFFKLVCARTDFKNSSNNTSKDFWSIGQFPSYLDEVRGNFSSWLLFLVDLSIFYFDLFFYEPSKYLSNNYFQFLISKFEFKIFLLLISLVSVLFLQIAIAWYFAKDKIDYFNKNQVKNNSISEFLMNI
ncbi:hypothetical protein BpHYR1_048943 [Brachionus plicatilis]|uniref:Uncharacterized protein n=1 Tax=Brachionus plicatilis TaxID=10195 RepID=A0A3M7QVH6_BRAPC|nr:hypothetical protein BpHYR1_048943 [Brachionus plicatilis]